MVLLALDGGPPIFLFYPNSMFKFNLQLIIVLPALLFLVLPAGSRAQLEERSLRAHEPKVAAPEFCEELRVTSAGVVCKSKFGLVASLDFPKVDLKNALTAGAYLPQATAEFTADEKTIGNTTYRNITLLLRWEPATPEFLQIYLDEYIPYWGNRVPYRLFWSVRYEECSINHCTDGVTVNEQGEFLPSDVSALQSDLAADVNFNGVPAAFWNTNIRP